MYKIMNAYMSKVQLQTGPELQQRLCDIVNSIKEIKSFSVTEHFKQFAIDMKLESFSVDRAAAVFHELQGHPVPSQWFAGQYQALQRRGGWLLCQVSAVFDLYVVAAPAS